MSFPHFISSPLHPSLPVRNCPPSHLSCDVYGPFCFCVLMTTVTESYPLPMRPDERCYPDALLTPLCPWPQRRRRASQIGPVKNENGEYLGEPDGGPVRHPATGCSKPSPALPPSRHRLLSSLYPANGNMRLVNGDDVVINPEVVNSALAFHLNIYLHPNRHSEGPPLPSRGHGRCPKGLTYRWWMLPCLILSVKQTRSFPCFDVLFKCLLLSGVKCNVKMVCSRVHFLKIMMLKCCSQTWPNPPLNDVWQGYSGLIYIKAWLLRCVLSNLQE